MHGDLSFKISQLRAKNQTMMVTAIAGIVAALFVSALLPTLLVRYIYANQQLLQQPVLLEYIPVVSFALGFGYFLFAAVGNWMRSRRISYLENKYEMEGGCCGHCGDGHCCHDGASMDDEVMMQELENLAEALVKEAPKKKETKKTAKKKTARKAKAKK